eukprot:6451545-Prorocentrum_lima.AAC.1
MPLLVGCSMEQENGMLLNPTCRMCRITSQRPTSQWLAGDCRGVLGSVQCSRSSSLSTANYT